MSTKKIRNREAKKIPRRINEVHPDGNRHTRRAKVAEDRLQHGRIKKQNIRRAHDKTLQRALVKIK